MEFQYIGAGAIAPVLSGDLTALGGGNALVTGEWFHAAAVFDGTNTELFFTRVDSGATLANSVAIGADFVDFTDLGPLTIGNEARTANNATGGTQFQEALLGSIDEVRISSVARGADEFIFAAAVPEPSSLALLGLGAVVGLARRRKS